MSSPALKEVEHIIDPLRTDEFGLVTHRVTQFDANVPGHTSKEDLESPEFWVNVANKLIMGSEIRCLADDMSFVAYGICTFVQGSTAKIKINVIHKLDQVNYDDYDSNAGAYETKLRGPKKWCIVKSTTGEVIKEDMPTKAIAEKELEDYQKALRS